MMLLTLLCVVLLLKENKLLHNLYCCRRIKGEPLLRSSWIGSLEQGNGVVACLFWLTVSDHCAVGWLWLCSGDENGSMRKGLAARHTTLYLPDLDCFSALFSDLDGNAPNKSHRLYTAVPRSAQGFAHGGGEGPRVRRDQHALSVCLSFCLSVCQKQHDELPANLEKSDAPSPPENRCIKLRKLGAMLVVAWIRRVEDT